VKRWLGLVGVAFVVAFAATGAMSSVARGESGGGDGCSAQSTKSEQWKKEHCKPKDSGGPSSSDAASSESGKAGSGVAAASTDLGKAGGAVAGVTVQTLEQRGGASFQGGGSASGQTSAPLKAELLKGSSGALTDGEGSGPGTTDRREGHHHGGPVATVPSSSVSQGSPTQSFNGLDGFDTRFASEGNQFSLEPPDQGLCAGNGFVVEPINDVIGVFSQSGGALLGSESLNQFFQYPAQINRVTGVVGPQVTDPSCLYDPASGRFIVDAVTYLLNPETGQPTGANRMDIAVSKSSDPTGGWNLYDFQLPDDGTFGTPVHPNCPCLGDYPHAGIDANGYYLTTNEYPWFANGFNGAQLYAISKKQLTSRAPSLKVLHYAELEAAGNPGFTVWPANTNAADYVSSNGGTEYFLSSMATPEANNTTGKDNRIAVWSLTNTSRLDTDGAPSLSNSVVETETYAIPPLSDQKAAPLENLPLLSCLKDVTPRDALGGLSCSQAVDGVVDAEGHPLNDPFAEVETEGQLDSNDSRMQQVWITQGLVVGSLDTTVNVNGQEKAGIAWFAFNPVGSQATLVSQGYVGVGGDNVNYPAAATLSNGAGVMTFTLVGRDYYPSAAYANVQVTPTGMTVGPVQIAAAGLGPQDGFTEYHVFAPTDSGVPRPRWGDYGAAVTDGNSLWFASEYSGQTCTYQQYLASGLTCGGTRSALLNWYTRISQLTP
jgi:hypothetical protein